MDCGDGRLTLDDGAPFAMPKSELPKLIAGPIRLAETPIDYSSSADSRNIVAPPIWLAHRAIQPLPCRLQRNERSAYDLPHYDIGGSIAEPAEKLAHTATLEPYLKIDQMQLHTAIAQATAGQA